MSVIVLEGIVSSGKTTLGRLIASLYDYQYVGDVASRDQFLSQNKELKEFSEFVIKKTRELKSVKEWYKNEQIVETLDKIFLEYDLRREKFLRKIAEEGTNLIIERNHMTTLAYSYALGRVYNLSNYRKLLAIFCQHYGEFLQPDYYVFLDIPLSVSIERQRRFGKNVPVEDIWNNSEFIKYFRDFCLDFATKHSRLIVISNTGSVRECLMNMIELLGL